MLHKKWMAMALLATAVASGSAVADNRGVNTALGAVLGAVIGNSVGGQDAAIIGGVLGAVVGASASGHNDRNYGRNYDRNYSRHQSQVYYQAPAPTYYRPAPVYVQPNYRGGYASHDAYRYQRDVRRVDYGRYDRNDNRNYRR